MANQRQRAATGQAIRYRIFLYTTAWAVVLFAIAGINIARPDLLSPITSVGWENAALHSLWFAMLGGVAISFKGLYDHWQYTNWLQGQWTLWYLGRPFSSAIVGAVTYVILQVTNPQQTPSIASIAVAAFILGTQERRFFNLLAEVAKLVLSVPNDPGPDTATPAAAPPQAKLVTPPAAGVVPKAAAPDQQNNVSFTDHGGTVLRSAKVQLIYWGSAWKQGASPAAADITAAVQSIVSGPYTSALDQYRGIGASTYMGSAILAASEPPNPFTRDHVATFVHDQIKSGAVPEPDVDPDLLYVVILPPGINSVDQTIIGEHSYALYADFDPPLDLDVNWMHYAWVTNDGTLGTVTTIFSHELVESCTDPEGTGWTGAAGNCSGSGWCEIGDVCSSTGDVGGVTVQSYWSERDSSCVVPGQR
jgi:hypothetical protein